MADLLSGLSSAAPAAALVRQASSAARRETVPLGRADRLSARAGAAGPPSPPSSSHQHSRKRGRDGPQDDLGPRRPSKHGRSAEPPSRQQLLQQQQRTQPPSVAELLKQARAKNNAADALKRKNGASATAELLKQVRTKNAAADAQMGKGARRKEAKTRRMSTSGTKVDGVYTKNDGFQMDFLLYTHDGRCTKNDGF